MGRIIRLQVPGRGCRVSESTVHSLNVTGRVVLVTGGASGIGFAIARAFVERGASVVVADTHEGQAGSADAGHVILRRADVSSREEIVGVVDDVVKDFGRLDILVNNAGVAHVDPLGAIDFERWAQLMAVNVTGAVASADAVVPHMRRAGWGRIINMSSAWSLVGVQTYSAYGASKAAIRQLSKVWAAELAPHSITVNSICPGWVKTPLLPRFVDRLAALHEKSVERVLEDVLHLVPQKRFLDPAEIAHCALFLASDMAKGITGTEIVVDAGLTSTLPDGLFARKSRAELDYDSVKREIYAQSPQDDKETRK